MARNREGLGDSRFDGEVALRSEIEALRAKTRDQSQLITRLQTLLVRAGVSADSVTIRSVNGTAADGGAHDSELVRLRSDLSDAESALRSAQSPAGASQGQTGTAIEAELRALKSENRDQAAEVARLKAALATFEAGEIDERGQAKDSKIAMKARLASMQAENETQSVTIQSLRAEIAGTNERLARQAAHFRDEMRRIGAGTLPASGDARRTSYEEPQRRSLTDRINEPRPRIVGGAATSTGEPAGTPASAARPAAIASMAARAETGPAAADTAVAPADKPARRSRLLERLTGTETPGG